MTAIGLVPWTKLGKVALAMPAIHKLAGKTGPIREALKKRSGALGNKLDNARNTPACPVTFRASYFAQKPVFTFGIHRSGNAGSEPRYLVASTRKCRIPSVQEAPFRGGNYNHLGTRFWKTTDDVSDLERHHILSRAVIKENPGGKIPEKMNPNNAPSIQMTPEDHRLTLSWGGKPKAVAYREHQAQLVREGRIDEVFQMEIASTREKFGDKYDQALSEMVQDAKKRGFITDAVQV